VGFVKLLVNTHWRESQNISQKYFRGGKRAMCLADCSSVDSAEVLSQSGRDPGIPGIDKKIFEFLVGIDVRTCD